MFRRSVKTIPERRGCRRPTDSVQVPIGSFAARILLIVGPNRRKEKIWDGWIGLSKRPETSPYLDARSSVLVIPAVKNGLRRTEGLGCISRTRKGSRQNFWLLLALGLRYNLRDHSPRRGGREAEGGGLLILPDLFAQTDFRLFCLH